MNSRSFAILDLGHETLDWVARDIMDIEADRVHRVTITQPDGAVLHVEKPTRGSADFRLVNLPADRSLAYASITNSMAGLLTDLSFEGVTEDVARLNNALAGWVYTLPSFKSRQFAQRMEALLKPVP